MWTVILVVWMLFNVWFATRKLFRRDPPRQLSDAEIRMAMRVWPRGWMGRK